MYTKFANQTYANLQIILVDDGSRDNSLKICEKYASLNSNIEVYHQNNKGVSAARNEGLKHGQRWGLTPNFLKI